MINDFLIKIYDGGKIVIKEVGCFNFLGDYKFVVDGNLEMFKYNILKSLVFIFSVFVIRILNLNVSVYLYVLFVFLFM